MLIRRATPTQDAEQGELPRGRGEAHGKLGRQTRQHLWVRGFDQHS
jgi:hypothetical protein